MKKNEYTLKEIVEGCKGNDERFKRILYESFYGYLSGIIFRYVKDRDEVQELVNDSFIKVFKNIKKITFPEDPDGYVRTFKGWIARISANTAIDRIRRKKSTLYIEDLDISQLNNFSQASSEQLSVPEILSMLSKLPELPRIIFNLYEIDGFSHKEIANMLNISEGSSRVYLGRAKLILKTFIHYLNSTP